MKKLVAIVLSALVFAAIPAVAVRAASAADAQTDKDWQAYANVWDAIRAGPPKGASNLQLAQYFETKNLELQALGLAFIEMHPADPRRWTVVDRFQYIRPSFVRDWGPLDDDGRPIQPVIDEAAAAAWNARVGELKMAMAKAADVPEQLKKEWAARAEAMEKVKAQRKAFPAMWSGGVMAPDFAEIDQAGREVRLSDFRGKVVVLDFWAPWCAPCNAAMPHNEEVAARYKDQGLVMLCACTSDTRANFEAWLRKNRAKYPDIVWTFDPAEKADGLVSKRLYSVMGIPTQFVISPTGKVIGVVEGYLKDETILEAKLAEAGVKVDPDLVAKGIEDLRKRHD